MEKPFNLSKGQLFFDTKFNEVYIFDRIEKSKGVDKWFVFYRKPFKIGQNLYYEGGSAWLTEADLEHFVYLPHCILTS